MLQLLKNKIKALNKNIVVKPVDVEQQGLIVAPDIAEHGYFYGSIQSVGDGCNKVIRPGALAFFKRLQGQKFVIDGGNFFIFKEDELLLIKWRGNFHPVGNKILLMRDVEEEQLESGIWIPACRQTKDQSLFGVVFRMGLVQAFPGINLPFDYPVNIGDKVKVRGWEMDIEEVGIDQRNCIIVKPKHLDYKVTNE